MPEVRQWHGGIDRQCSQAQSVYCCILYTVYCVYTDCIQYKQYTVYSIQQCAVYTAVDNIVHYSRIVDTVPVPQYRIPVLYLDFPIICVLWIR